VSNGYYDATERVTDDAIVHGTVNAIVNERIVVLTEGRTDRTVLRESLTLLYPHLTDYFTFMDFDAVNAAGGASQSVAILKAFIGAKIANRTVALFDNDTAAKDALRGLDGCDLPSNVRVVLYPPIAIANNYPTIGPGGMVPMDVNGHAGSIELYFGEDILRRGGHLVPVQWRSMNDSIGQFHGVLGEKRSLQQAFYEKLKHCKEQPALIGQRDWSGIIAILDVLRTVFSDSLEPHLLYG